MGPVPGCGDGTRPKKINDLGCAYVHMSGAERQRGPSEPAWFRGGEGPGQTARSAREPEEPGCGRAMRTAIADERVVDLRPIIADVKASGALSLREIAAGLNGRGIPTARGGSWSAVAGEAGLGAPLMIVR